MENFGVEELGMEGRKCESSQKVCSHTGINLQCQVGYTQVPGKWRQTKVDNCTR